MARYDCDKCGASMYDWVDGICTACTPKEAGEFLKRAARLRHTVKKDIDDVVFKVRPMIEKSVNKGRLEKAEQLEKMARALEGTKR